MRNKLTLRLLTYFGAALLTFALISGALFQALFTRHTVDAKRADMLQRATSLAQTLSDALSGGETTGRGMGGQGMGSGYGAFVRALGLLDSNAWVVDENLDFLTAGHFMGSPLTYADLPADAGALVRQVFEGQTPFSEGFSAVLGTPTLTVGAPIMDNGKVAGALLLHDSVAGVDAASEAGFRILLLSGAAALVIAIFLSVLLSYAFARPLEKMNATVLRLADGDYAARTAITRPEPFDRLARALDALGQRLGDAKQAEAMQEQLRNDFLANVSHELRTPVTVLRGSLEALCDGVVQTPEQEDAYHRQMLSETRTLQRLVNDLMELARLQNADFPMQKSMLSLAEPLTDAVRSASQMAQGKNIRIHTTLASEPIPFSGDYGRLRQMFLTVLDNAVKYSPEDTVVTVMLAPGEVSVRDQGPGIPPEELPMLFDRFRRARDAQPREGSGLGLAIARQIAQRHGMSISVESEPGQGSLFRFTWPINVQDGAPA